MMSLWAEPADSISFSVVYPIHPSKDALYGFFYGSAALTKYLLNVFSSIVKFEFKLDFFFLLLFALRGLEYDLNFVSYLFSTQDLPLYQSFDLYCKKKKEFNEILSKVVKN